MMQNRIVKLSGLIFCSVLLAGCSQNVTPPIILEPDTTTVTHLVYITRHPANLETPATRLEFYLSDQGDRMILEDYGDDFPEHWFSHTVMGVEYFTGPIVDEHMRAELPPASVYKDVDGPTIIKIDSKTIPNSQRLGLPRQTAEEILTIDPTWLNSILKEPYTVVVGPYAADPEADGQRRLTIDPKTNYIRRIEKFIVDAAGQEQVYQVINVETQEEIPLTDLPNDFFALEGWQKDLPADHYTIVVDDID